MYALQNALYTGVYSGATLIVGWLSTTTGVQSVFLIAAGLWLIILGLSRRLIHTPTHINIA